MSREYGENFFSINLRGSWLRGIPIHGDDIDVLFIVKDLNAEEKKNIREYTRQHLHKANELFCMCDGKVVMGIKVDPIIFLDIVDIGMIMNRFMYGLGHFLKRYQDQQRDNYQDSFFGTKITEKKIQFLKSGILIPFVGWIYGRERKQEVFDEISRFLPVPTIKTPLYSDLEINEAKETIREIFIGRNLIYPSLEIKKWINLENWNVEGLKKEVMHLYAAIKPLEDVFARAVVNYIYTLKIEEKLLGRILTRDRVTKFAPSYDKLVDDILTKSIIRLAACTPLYEHERC